MKPDRQIEELAKIEFGDDFDGMSDSIALTVWVIENKGTKNATHRPAFRNYLRSHDALQPIINGLYDSAQLAYDYHDEITEICSGDYLYVHTATCEQKAEAILKAYGKWEER